MNSYHCFCFLKMENDLMIYVYCIKIMILRYGNSKENIKPFLQRIWKYMYMYRP